MTTLPCASAYLDNCALQCVELMFSAACGICIGGVIAHARLPRRPDAVKKESSGSHLSHRTAVMYAVANELAALDAMCDGIAAEI